MQLSIHTSLETINPEAWNALNSSMQPFLRHEFLIALERNGVMGKVNGWLPRYFILENQGGLLGVAPCYLKHNSHGEFVFDWAWADAYHQSGLNYYPKLVNAVPYSPIQGERYLVSRQNTSQAQQQLIKETLHRGIIEYSQRHQLSSYHRLFTDSETDQPGDLLHRFDYQYHWQNQQYNDFEDFLSGFKSRKRRKTRQERRTVEEEGIKFNVISGQNMNDSAWKIAFEFYRNTFYQKGNKPVLTLDFFREISRSMGEQIVVIFALKDNTPIACAINFRDQKRLYGRYWGCLEHYDKLHFETCFYQGIEYCIREGLQYFEPGAQGEHKITRGFLPVKTHSFHWIAEPHFKQAIDDYLKREKAALTQYLPKLQQMSPFKSETSE